MRRAAGRGNDVLAVECRSCWETHPGGQALSRYRSRGRKARIVRVRDVVGTRTSALCRRGCGTSGGLWGRRAKAGRPQYIKNTSTPGYLTYHDGTTGTGTGRLSSEGGHYRIDGKINAAPNGCEVDCGALKRQGVKATPLGMPRRAVRRRR